MPEEPEEPESISPEVSGPELTDTKEPDSPTQDGLIESYMAFHNAAKGEIYDKIVSNFGKFDFSNFYK
jgi:hypothetical protein